MDIMDIFFVLILCFIILFSTLVITNNISLNDYTVNGYRINVPILAGVAVSEGRLFSADMAGMVRMFRI